MTTIDLKLTKTNPRLFFKDVLLITIMAVLAACGLIYQYLLSNYAGRILGVMEHAIFTMIGIMIVSMGIGSFAAKLVKCPFSGFAWLEIIIAFLGATGILIIGGAFALAYIFPAVLAENYGMPYDLIPHGGVVIYAEKLANVIPYVIGFIIGLLIGMEIPFIARVRENIYGQHLEHNVGTIYGADYIGAGIGAAIFIIWMLSSPPEVAAVYTAIANLFAGLAFFFMFHKKIKFAGLLFMMHLCLGVLFISLFSSAENMNKTLQDVLYDDKVVFSKNTDFQHITLTERKMSSVAAPIYTLYLNGRTQFSSSDEHIYHDMLVHPAMLASRSHDNVLIIGGGDGLALRDVLKWNPEKVTLLELDKEMVKLFSEPELVGGKVINESLLKLNRNSFSDPRVEVILGDAYNSIDKLLSQNRKYNTIIVDLPDPSHPNLNKLYAARFYKKLFELLNGDGAISVQSTSPYHAKLAFLTVGVTLEHAGFEKIQRYHQNVPSFGQWGWTIATKFGASPQERIRTSEHKVPDNSWATNELVLASFEFGKGFFDDEENLEPNRLGSNLMYILHKKAWLEDGES